MTQIIPQEDGPMEREIIAEIAEMKPGRERGRKLLTYVCLIQPDEWEYVDPSEGEWELMFSIVLTHVQEETGFSDEQMRMLVSNYDEALDKWWWKNCQ